MMSNKKKHDMTSNRTIEQQRRDRRREDVDDISILQTPFNRGVLRASTPVSTAAVSSFQDPFDHTFFETSACNHYLTTHHCPRTYSRPKKPVSPVTQLSDCSINLNDVNIESPQTLHNKAEKEGRFRNMKRVFSVPTPSPENEIEHEEENVPPGWLLFQSPKKPIRSEFSGPSRKKARSSVGHRSVSVSAKKKSSRPRKQATSKSRGIPNKMSKRGRLPLKVKFPQNPPLTPSVTREQDRPARNVNKPARDVNKPARDVNNTFGFDDSD